jgi:hypothetical protein
MSDQTRRALEDLIAAECAAQPLDARARRSPVGRSRHRAQRRRAAAQPPPICRSSCSAPAAPRSLQIFPGLWEKRSPEIIRAGALTPEGQRAAGARRARRRRADELLERIVARAGGHPLHLEEIVRAVAEGGGDALPDTVLAMVQARHRGAGARGEARAPRREHLRPRLVAARGRGAARRGRAAHTTRDWLRELCDREWLSERDAPRFPGEEELAFRQDMAREAAYGMLTEIDRRLGHRLAGDWLERAGEDAGLVLARHFDLGGDAPRAVERLRPRRRAGAGERRLRRGDRARRARDPARRRGRGARPRPPRPGRGPRATRRVRGRQARGDEAMRCSRRASPAWWRAAGAVAHSSGKLGDLARLEVVSTALLDRPTHPSSSCAAACANAAVQLYLGGRPALADALIARLARLAATSSDPAVQAHAARTAGIRLRSRATPPRPSSTCAPPSPASRPRAISAPPAPRRRPRAGTPASAARSRKASARCASRSPWPRASASPTWSPTPSTTSAHRCSASASSTRPRASRKRRSSPSTRRAIAGWRAAPTASLSWIHRLKGDLDEAEREARTALDPSRLPIRCGSPRYAYLAATLARGRSRRPRPSRRPSRAARCSPPAAGTEEGVGMLQLAHAEALFALGRRDEATRAVAVGRRTACWSAPARSATPRCERASSRASRRTRASSRSPALRWALPDQPSGPERGKPSSFAAFSQSTR